MANGDTKLKDWYTNEFPNDPCGNDMDGKATFYDLYVALDVHEDVYKVIFNGNPSDSIVRERCFAGLAEIMGCEYNYIYDQWLRKPGETKKPVQKNEDAPKVGDIWYSQWGYDQTNIDYYQVTKVTKAMVWLTPIGSHTTETGFMSGECIPLPDHFCGKAERHKFKTHKFNGKDEFYCSINSYKNAYEWDGEPKRCSWYA